ncbi:MAG TPA: DctP family TRAP transporter solute-binding subunit [Burkholderiaceae bacterium]|nr:DctP family TRAP transporter solute-binding subunit [Burkholderiaceae bacterium]
MLKLATVANLSRRRVLHGVAASACAALGGAQALASPPGALGHARAELLIRFAHVVAPDTPKGLAVERFRALVSQRSEGRIQVSVHPNAQLYGDHDEMQALQLGAVEMLAPSLSKFGRVGFAEFELFDLPYLFADLASVRRVTQGPLGARLLARLQRQRLVGLGFMDNGFKHMSANRPLLEPAHFAGLRMRVQASRVIAEQMRALGARPVTLAFSETHRALAAGVVDGTENPVSNFWTQRMHEVQSDLSLTQHAYLGYAVVTNQRFWEGVNVADRQLIGEALAEALAHGNAIADEQNASALNALRQTGGARVHTPSAAQLEAMRRATQGVHDALGQRIGAHWLADIRQALQSG